MTNPQQKDAIIPATRNSRRLPKVLHKKNVRKKKKTIFSGEIEK
jgi:hypothetical protein